MFTENLVTELADIMFLWATRRESSRRGGLLQRKGGPANVAEPRPYSRDCVALKTPCRAPVLFSSAFLVLWHGRHSETSHWEGTLAGNTLGRHAGYI